MTACCSAAHATAASVYTTLRFLLLLLSKECMKTLRTLFTPGHPCTLGGREILRLIVRVKCLLYGQGRMGWWLRQPCRGLP